MKVASFTTLLSISTLASSSTAQPTNGKNPVAPQSNPTGDVFLKQLIETAPLGFNVSTVRQLQTIVSTSAAGVVGEIITLPFDTIPPGFLECNGQALSRDEYPELFAAIGTTYGLGTAVINTFKLPDYRGYFPRMRDNGAGVDPDRGTRTNRGDGTTGDAVGTKQGDIFLSHRHTVPRDGRTPVQKNSINAGSESGGTPDNLGISDGGYPFKTLLNSDGGGAETRSKNVYVVFAIRAKPISDTSQSVKTLQLCDQAGQNCVKPSDIVALAQKADQTSVSVAALTTDVSRHQQSISQIQEKVTTNTQTIQVLSKENTRLKQNITQTTGMLKQTRDELDLTKNELSKTKNNLSSTQTKLELTINEISSIKTQYEIALRKLSDLESVYQIIDQSKAKDIQSTQSEQSQQLRTQDLWLIGLSIIGGIEFLMILCLFLKRTDTYREVPNDKTIPTAQAFSLNQNEI